MGLISVKKLAEIGFSYGKQIQVQPEEKLSWGINERGAAVTPSAPDLLCSSLRGSEDAEDVSHGAWRYIGLLYGGADGTTG